MAGAQAPYPHVSAQQAPGPAYPTHFFSDLRPAGLGGMQGPGQITRYPKGWRLRFFRLTVHFVHARSVDM